MGKAAFKKKKGLFTSKLDLNLRKKVAKLRIGSLTVCGIETGTLRKIDLKYSGEAGWRVSVINGEVLHRIKDERNILPAVKRRKVNWIGNTLRRNCLLKHFFLGGGER